MTFNDVRNNDLTQIIRDLHQEYDQIRRKVYYEFKAWVERGKPIKKSLLDDTRTVYNMAERNLEYSKMLLAHYKRVGYIETEMIKKIICEETAYYEAEVRRLRELKFLIPLVKPLVQLKNNRGE